jgi:hypothetical protein
MSNEIDIAGLRNLAASGKRSKIGRMRSILSEIENVIRAGVSLELVVAELNVQGMELTLATFKMMLYRLRKESKEAVPATGLGKANCTTDKSDHLLQGIASQQNYSTAKKSEESKVNSGVATAVPKSETPGEPNRFNWAEHRNAKNLWK